MPAEASRRLAAGAEPGDDPGITLAHGLPMRRLALLLGFCLLLAFSAGGQLLAGPPGMTTQASPDPSAVATSSHAHAAHAPSASAPAERLADCPDETHGAECLAAGHCLSGTAGRFSLANAPAEATCPPPPGLRHLPAPCDRLEHPPRTA